MEKNFYSMMSYFLNPYLTEEELDKQIWENTKYEGMNFTREGDWVNFDKTYASPVFHFENGDRAVFDKCGKIVVL